ncbi:MAG TPA: nitroreductase/quinone reductase family protein [Mycobacterium sp.]|nr:nitroreductase/quinone reductase family protein [Mycobacterium sp.]HTX97081.1 nitroreductase/quinone reductase family protein [Mycobacterium sp.]
MRHVVGAALTAAFVAAVARRIRIAAGMRRGDQAVIDAKRRRNSRFANKMVTRVGRAGRRRSIFGVIDCTGRRTGKRYSTPIRVVEEPGGFIVPLTYGTRTGWYVNLKEAPGRLYWQGRTIPVGNPLLIPTSAVVHRFPPPSRFLLRLDGTQQCVRLQDLSR